MHWVCGGLKSSWGSSSKRSLESHQGSEWAVEFTAQSKDFHASESELGERRQFSAAICVRDWTSDFCQI